MRLLGTPAEEVGNPGGKDLLIERGAFDGVHAAMMVRSSLGVSFGERGGWPRTAARCSNSSHRAFAVI